MSVKRMIGETNSTEMRYLKGLNNQEIYEDEGKEKIFRENWKKIFQISLYQIRKMIKLIRKTIGLLKIIYNKITKS